MPTRRPRRRRDAGFSLIIVFMLVIIMIGVAAAVMLSTQEDLAVSGQDREALTAFYAAEYGVAQAKDYLYQAAKNQWSPITTFTNWTPILTTLRSAGVSQGCLPLGAGTMQIPVLPRMAWQSYNTSGGTAQPFKLGPGEVMWRYCIHNNTDDVAYLDLNGDGPLCGSTSVGTGDTCDARDPLHLITVDAWGVYPVDNSGTPLPGAATSHIAVNIPPPTPKTQAPVGNCSYGVEGGCGAHDGNGGVDTTNVK